MQHFVVTLVLVLWNIAITKTTFRFNTLTYNILWFLDDASIIKIDEQIYTFKKNQIITLTEFYHLGVIQMGKAKMFQFNRDFYCIVEHDSEVDCKGILFFGSNLFLHLEIKVLKLMELLL